MDSLTEPGRESERRCSGEEELDADELSRGWSIPRLYPQLSISNGAAGLDSDTRDVNWKRRGYRDRDRRAFDPEPEMLCTDLTRDTTEREHNGRLNVCYIEELSNSP